MKPKARRARPIDMRLLMVGLLALLLVACGDESPEGEDPTHAEQVTMNEEAEVATAGEFARPPDVVVEGGGEVLSLEPFTYCWSTGCADGAPPETVPEIGAAEEVTVEFPVEGWEFLATFQSADDVCGRTQTIELEPTSATTFALPPAGFAGTYDVDLFGRGADGDVVVQFRWETPTDGELPKPDATLAVLAGHDGIVDSYGVEFSVTNLAESPDEVEARITVTAAGGESLSFEPTPANYAPEGCSGVEGSLFWDGPDDKGLEAAGLGDGPFTYTVELVLDGVLYEASAVWPDDEMPDYAPSVPLVFEPDLPALSPAR